MLRRGSLPLPLCFVVLFCYSSKLTVLANGPYECSQGGHGAHDLIENGVMNPKYQWYKRGKKTYVPVVMDHSYSYDEHSTIVGGLHEISQKTCIEFDIYDNEAEVEVKDYVYINKNTKRGCYSYIGRIGGKQEIGLPVGCISHRTAMHEMLHALGFRHEHVRYDRDDYIVVYWENIRRGRESNFKKRSPSDLVSGPYDYESIMHYERKAFSQNGQDTIRPLKHGATIGVRQQMSYWDAQKVNIVYKCGGSYSNSDVSNLLEYSPELLSYNEGLERNDSSLPIAEYDDFNREPAPRNSRSNYRSPSSRDYQNHLNHNHHDDEDDHSHNLFGPPPPPPPSSSRPRQHDDHSENLDENNENGVESFADDHYDHNDPNNRIHYRNNQQHQRPRQNREHSHRRNTGDEFLTYLTDTDSPSSGRARSSTPNNDNGNAEPFYDDFYDF